MLKYIKIKNFLSFKDETEISFLSSNYGNKKNNVFSIGKNTLMKSMLIYGPNASGKSNILKAVSIIKSFVNGSHINPNPFLLDKNSRKNPSFFEIGFFVYEKEYLYNFELLDGIVVSENLFEVTKSKQKILFTRNKQDIKFDNELKSFTNQIETKVREDTSLIWILDQFNGKINGKHILYFFDRFNTLGMGHSPVNTIKNLDLEKSDKNKKFVIEFLKCADISICDFKIVKQKSFLETSNGDKKEIEGYRIFLSHKVYGTKETVDFDLGGFESTGTEKLFGILGMLAFTILEGGILFFDEIENSLHPHIVKNIFRLLHSNLGRNYQFVFTTHNVELMNLNEFKNEQIGITEKDKFDSTTFYTLSEFSNLRKELDIQKLYNLGELGGIPLVKDFSSLIENIKLGENDK